MKLSTEFADAVDLAGRYYEARQKQAEGCRGMNFTCAIKSVQVN